MPTRGVWGHAPPGKFRLLLTQSGTRLLFNTCDKTLITILNFKISSTHTVCACAKYSVKFCVKKLYCPHVPLLRGRAWKQSYIITSTHSTLCCSKIWLLSNIQQCTKQRAVQHIAYQEGEMWSQLPVDVWGKI